MRLARLAAATAVVLSLLSLAGPGAAMAAAPALPAGASSAAPPELPAAPEVRSVNGVAHLALTAAIDPATKLPAFFFAGRTTPPTIRVWPGDTLVIDYTNRLPVSSTPPLDMTNLHTHGLMDSPKAPGDQVIMTMIAPGATYRYVFGIPRNQPPGLYWYHPHPHGESNHQVASGMSGLIVVEGIETYAPAVRGLAERDIILRDYYYDTSLAPLSRGRRRAVMAEVARLQAKYPSIDRTATIRAVAADAASLPASTPDCSLGDASDGVTINGVQNATITMRPGSHQFFRVANASANSYFDLKIPGSSFLVVAYDGVPLSFHNRSVQAQWADHVLIPPAGRAEIIVSAPAKSGTPFETGCIDTGPDGDNDPGRVLASIELGPEPAVVHAALAARPAIAEPFGNIQTAAIAVRRSVVFSEDNPDSLFYINGQLWNPNAPPMFTARAGTVEEWTLSNTAGENHVFHIHQVHFLVESVNGVPQPAAASWRDTVTVPYAKMANGNVQPGVVRVLVDFRDPIIVGTFVFHCHILEHEDYGMMAKITVVGPRAAAFNTRGFKEGFLTNASPAACKLQTKTFKLCGCDKPRNVSYQPPRG